MYIEIIVMAIVALAGGLAPLYIQLDMSLVSNVAAGIILGTAFVIVIPEGVEVASNEIIGYPLLLGYLMMYCIDACIHLQKNARKKVTVTVNQLELEQEPSELQILGHTISSTSMGLIIHSLADGIAFGAASLLPNARVELSVLLAVLVHKAPAAFSFCTLLKAQRVPQKDIIRDVILFAAAAPVAALLVHLCVTDGEHFIWWAGQALLFSGGSFLFVAMHVMPPLHQSSDIVAVVAGITLPLITSLFKD